MTGAAPLASASAAAALAAAALPSGLARYSRMRVTWMTPTQPTKKLTVARLFVRQCPIRDRVVSGGR